VGSGVVKLLFRVLVIMFRGGGEWDFEASLQNLGHRASREWGVGFERGCMGIRFCPVGLHDDPCLPTTVSSSLFFRYALSLINDPRTGKQSSPMSLSSSFCEFNPQCTNESVSHSTPSVS